MNDFVIIQRGVLQWLDANRARPLAAAIIIVIALSAFKSTRPYSTPIGVIIMALWFWKWKRTA